MNRFAVGWVLSLAWALGGCAPSSSSAPKVELPRSKAGAIPVAAQPAAVKLAEEPPAEETPAEETLTGARRDVVLWVSMDGFRADYFTLAPTPHLDRLKREGVYSLELEPIFPSLTFPSHVSQATGVRVAKHGIPSNSFYDAERDRVYAYPGFGSILQSEPIWLTAARQGVRVASVDWPLSHGQRGKVRAAYFQDKFEMNLTDTQRVERLLKIWSDDREQEPLRLIMGYVIGTDMAGHEFGPNTREVAAALKELDARIGELIDGAIKNFERRRRGDEQLYVILTTDHGMAAVHTLVHLGLLAQTEELDDVTLSTGGNVGDLFFKADMPDREAAIERALKQIATAPYARAWRRADLPAEWELAHPTRVGDIVVALDAGYAFSRRQKETTVPAAGGSLLGMHGYDPKQHPEMLGPAIFWRYPKPLAPRKLGRVDALQLHPTVAALLGIEPAAQAQGQPIALETPAP